jgi:hypothetical protein
MAIADLFGTTFSVTVTGDHSSGTSTITFFTPSNRITQAAVSVADVRPGCAAEARIVRVNIPGFGDIELRVPTTTIRLFANSVTFSLSSQTVLGGTTVVMATVLLGVYSA